MASFLKNIIASSTSAIAGIAAASSAFPYQEVKSISNHETNSNENPGIIWDLSESNKVSLVASNSSESTAHANNIPNFMPQTFTVFSRRNLRSITNGLEGELIRNGSKRWKMLRHPKCLTFSDSNQSDAAIFIATDYVVPVNLQFCETLDNESKCWGIYQIASALQFLHRDCQLFHGNVRVGACAFADKSGQWKLGSFELTCSLKDCYIYQNGKGFFKGSYDYLAPEVVSDSWNSIPCPDAIDSWAFGIFIFEVFNAKRWNPNNKDDFGLVPKALHESLRGFLHQDPRVRLTVSNFLNSQKLPNGYFNNAFLNVIDFIDNYSVQSQADKESFFNNIASHGLVSFPVSFRLYKIIPILSHSIEYGTAGKTALQLVPLLIEESNRYSDEEHEKLFLPILIKLFQNQDRAIRSVLLDKGKSYQDKLSQKTLCEKIYPLMATGFQDQSPVIREATLRSCCGMADKLSPSLVNDDLVRNLSKLQMDEQPGIRTNAMIAIGKLVKSLNESSRKKILTPAFTRALQDPFPPCRMSALKAVNATLEYFEPSEIAVKLFPLICPMTVDSENTIRTSAFKCANLFLKKLEENAKKMDLHDAATAKASSETSSSRVTSPDRWTAASKMLFSSSSANRSSEDLNKPKSSEVKQQIAFTPAYNNSFASPASNSFSSSTNNAFASTSASIANNNSFSQFSGNQSSSFGAFEAAQPEYKQAASVPAYFNNTPAFLQQSAALPNPIKPIVEDKSKKSNPSNNQQGWDSWDDNWDPM